MLIAMILGAAFGVGILLLVKGLRAERPDLATALARLHAPLAPAPIFLPGDDADSSLVRRARPLAKHLAAFNLPGTRLQRDLTLIERSPTSLLAEKAAGGIAAGLLPAVLSIAGHMALGINLGVLTTIGAALAAGTAGFIAPDFQVRTKAAAYRVRIRRDLSAYLDLTVITLAGGAGTETALAHAAASGTGPTFARIRSALTRGAHQGRPAAAVLADLGEETGVPAFSDLGSSLALAGSEGARIRAALTAKARVMRKQALSEDEAKAGAATEHLSVPMVVLVLGFLLFLGFPAVSVVASSFGR